MFTRKHSMMTPAYSDLILLLITLFISIRVGFTGCSTNSFYCNVTDSGSQGLADKSQTSLQHLDNTSSSPDLTKSESQGDHRDLPNDIVGKSEEPVQGKSLNSTLRSIKTIVDDGGKVKQAKGVATVAASVRRGDDDDGIAKIVGIVVPFTLVIFLAGVFYVTCKLCQKYRCYKNEEGLGKCLTFCDRCMSAPDVFHTSGSAHDQNSTGTPSSSYDSAPVFRRSLGSSSSSTSSKCSSSLAPMIHYHRGRSGPTFTTVNMSLKYFNSSLRSNVSRQESSRTSKLRIGPPPSSRHKFVQTSVALRISEPPGVHKAPRHSEVGSNNGDYSQRHSTRFYGRTNCRDFSSPK